MPTLAEVKAQIKALPHKYIFYTKREINYLPKIMTDDEQIVALTSGFHGNTTVLLVCTNRRLLFIDKGMFFGLKVKQLNLDRIQSLDSSYVIVFGKIRIWDGAAAYEIGMIFKDSIDPFVRAVRDAIENYRRLVYRDVVSAGQAPPQHFPPPTPRPQSQAPEAPKPQPSLSGHPKIAPAPQSPYEADMLTQLERLAKLREEGHLSDEEFEAQKKKLLS
jgi:hypothetical protein